MVSFVRPVFGFLKGNFHHNTLNVREYRMLLARLAFLSRRDMYPNFVTRFLSSLSLLSSIRILKVVASVGTVSAHNVVLVEVYFHVIFLPVFDKKKCHPSIQKRMAETFNSMEKDLLFSAQDIWIATVSVSVVPNTSGSFMSY